MRGALGAAFKSISRSGMGVQAGVGAAVGGAYGAFSDDTSIIGGALAGAALGVGVGAAGRGARMYGKMMGRGATRGQAVGAAFRDIGRRSSRFFGAGMKSNAAVNPIASGAKATGSGATNLGVHVPGAAARRKQQAMSKLMGLHEGRLSNAQLSAGRTRAQNDAIGSTAQQKQWFR